MTHYYKDGGWSKPGVTSIIADTIDKSGPLTQWAANMVVEWIKKNCDSEPKYVSADTDEIVYAWQATEEDLNNARFNFKEVSQDALDIGSEVHHAIETWLKTGKEPKDPRPEVLSAFLAFLEFFDAHHMKPIELEFSVIGDYFGGTLDFYGEIDGELTLIDFKTSKYHYPNEHGPQIAAYKSALPTRLWPSTTKTNPLKGIKTGILRIDKSNGFPDYKDYSKRYERDLKHFNLMKELYLHRHPRIAKGAGFCPPF